MAIGFHTLVRRSQTLLLHSVSFFSGAGKIVTACLSMIGIAFFSLPAVRKPSLQPRFSSPFSLGNSRCVDRRTMKLDRGIAFFRLRFCFARSAEGETEDVSQTVSSRSTVDSSCLANARDQPFASGQRHMASLPARRSGTR